MVNATASDPVRRKALEVGFSHVGIAPATLLDVEHDRLNDWITRGYHGSMAWLSRDTLRRADPRSVLPGARSVVVVAKNYWTPERHADDIAAGKISRYAWGDDYHDILPPMLEAVEEAIREAHPEARTRRYVDTGPVMEKAWAARAGIGWIGKHTNLITRDLGSWVFLGVILTTAELTYDSPATDHCGDCVRCIEACPTQAIVAPYILDSNRCIPYLTIEWRGEEIPGGERMDFRNWVFGCDICQDVCPWNSFQQPTPDVRHAPRPGLTALSLDGVIAMDEAEFQERFRRSPVKRAKRTGLQRNARTVLRQHASNASS